MVQYIYLAVIIAATVWMLYRLWRRLHGRPVTNSSTPEIPGQTVGSPPETHDVRMPEPAAKPAVRRKRREEAEGYEDKFLVNQASKYRITVNISRELFDRVRSFLPVIAPDVTMTSSLNSIITEHIETHLDEINELYNSKIKKQL